jgi:tRNA pseudouridine38-40 synthase
VEASEVSLDFHARRDAHSRQYDYFISNKRHLSPFVSGRVFFVPDRLDKDLMRSSLAAIVGIHDFSAFCVATSAGKGCIREVLHASLDEVEQDLLRIRIVANAFVHQMVRSLVGTVVEIGQAKKEPGLLPELLKTGDRQKVGKTAPACGLFLSKIEYGDQ